MTKHAFAKWIASLIPNEAQPMKYYSLDLTGHVPDHGTSHVVAIDHEGNAVSATSSINQLLYHKIIINENTLNLRLGSKRMSPTLAIEKQASVVQALILMDDGFIHGNSDFRRKTATYPAGY
uniref:Uncharacterized protein n=1 Tax=Meloidogyne javanica TaxID=6303 RepID=A0A915MVG9_MELJA